MSDTDIKTGIRIVPETPRLGAVVEGVNGKEPLPADVVEEMKQALLKYKVLFIPNQNLTSKEQADFARNFGAPFEEKSTFDDDFEEPGLTGVSVVPHFHSDHMYGERQPSFALLQMVTTPTLGGDTMWADLVSSYQTLSASMRDFLEPLMAVNVHPTYFLDDDGLRRAYERQYHLKLTPEQLKERRFRLRPHEHPVVRTIPETGDKNYWVSAQHTVSIKELSKAESAAVLGFLFQHQLRPEFVVRWKWSAGDLALWDHRTTLHSGVHDYGPEHRAGQRVNILATQPVPALVVA